MIAKQRVEALSDGIYAIALTLLVLELKLPVLPHDASNVAVRDALISLAPKGLTWLLSFFVIALFWLAQQRLYKFCRAPDGRMVRLELVQLCLISLFPFSNALMGEHGGRVVAAVFYAGHLLAIALCAWARTLYFVRHAELHAPEMTVQLGRAMRNRGVLVAGCALVALIAGFVAPGLNMLAMLPTVLLSRIERL